MQETSTVKFQKGKADTLVIAPHGVMGDDDRTDIIAATMAAKLGCSFLINNTIKRDQCDYNKIKKENPHGWRIFGAITGCTIGLIGGLVGTYFSIKNTTGPKERAFMVKASIVVWTGIVLFLGLVFILPSPCRYFL